MKKKVQMVTRCTCIQATVATVSPQIITYSITTIVHASKLVGEQLSYGGMKKDLKC